LKKPYLPETDLQRSLAFEADTDPMNFDQEQTWPTTEELEKAQAEQNQFKKRVPKGTSEYQAAWILSDEEEEDNHSHDEQNDFDDDQQDMITANTDDLESIQLDQQEEEEEEEEEEMDELIINKNNYDEKLDLEEDKQALKKN